MHLPDSVANFYSIFVPVFWNSDCVFITEIIGPYIWKNQLIYLLFVMVWCFVLLWHCSMNYSLMSIYYNTEQSSARAAVRKETSSEKWHNWQKSHNCLQDVVIIQMERYSFENHRQSFPEKIDFKIDHHEENKRCLGTVQISLNPAVLISGGIVISFAVICLIVFLCPWHCFLDLSGHDLN